MARRPRARPVPRASLPLDRRRFLKRLLGATGALALGGCSLESVREPRVVQVTHPTIAIPGLPSDLDGLTICQITDVHHGPYLDRERVRRVVDLVNSLRPDLIAISGDSVSRDVCYIGPVWREFARLQAPLGIYSVLGNHDHWVGADETRAATAEAGIVELDNRAVPLGQMHVQGSDLYLAGVDDLWTGSPDLETALEPLPPQAAVILLSHQPDFADEVRDPRVKLILAGHSHGGQVVLPLLGPLHVPCRRKYAAGLAQGPCGLVYTSRGIGCVTPPIRFLCPPELPVLSLRCTP